MEQCPCIAHRDYPGISLPPPPPSTLCDGCGRPATLAVEWNDLWPAWRISLLGAATRTLNYCENCARGVSPEPSVIPPLPTDDDDAWDETECAGCGGTVVGRDLYCVYCTTLNDEDWSL